jgi:hypothetical protein
VWPSSAADSGADNITSATESGADKKFSQIRGDAPVDNPLSISPPNTSGFTPAAPDLRRQVRLCDLSRNDGHDTFYNNRQ